MTTTQNPEAANTALDKIQSPVAPRPAGVGQATAIEQSRALAEVQAAVYVARQFPRDLLVARHEMLDACNQLALAERSFFSFRRGGQSVTGPSVHIARELARCWGNIQYGLVELSRDDNLHESQMLAYAWDVQTNARSSSTFIVPHIRDTKDGRKAIVDVRDVYENNANQGARRVREAIFAVLPTWFVEEAKTACRTTLETGGGTPLPKRIDDMVAAFKRAGVTIAQLEARVSMPRSEWTVQEVATLSVVFTSLRNGETRRDDEFPPVTAPVSAEEVTGQAAAPAASRPRGRAQAAPADVPAADEPADPEVPDPHDGDDPWAGAGQ